MSDTVHMTMRICPRCGQESNAAICQSDGTNTVPKTPQTDQVGDALVGQVLKDRYRLLEPLGKGGMGAVYKAEHLRLKSLVAVKILDATLTSEQSEQYQRFLREGQVISALVHPNIVRALDFDVQDGRAFLVIDYIEGKSLQDLLDESPRLPFQRALPIFMQICDALGYAHSQGVLHRDLKPANVMLINNEEQKDSVRLLDFGLAKLLDNGNSNRLTQTGMIFGTPLYMSPEQCLGRELDQRSDIYSLGCLMYEALVGQPPIKGTNSMATLQKQIAEPPASFEQQEIADVPPQLVSIVMQTLEKSPEKRPSSTLELRQKLEAALSAPAKSQRPGASRVELIPGAVTKRRRVNLLVLAAALAATAAAAAGICAFHLPLPFGRKQSAQSAVVQTSPSRTAIMPAATVQPPAIQTPPAQPAIVPAPTVQPAATQTPAQPTIVQTSAAQHHALPAKQTSLSIPRPTHQTQHVAEVKPRKTKAARTVHGKQSHEQQSDVSRHNPTDTKGSRDITELTGARFPQAKPTLEPILSDYFQIEKNRKNHAVMKMSPSDKQLTTLIRDVYQPGWRDPALRVTRILLDENYDVKFARVRETMVQMHLLKH